MSAARLTHTTPSADSTRRQLDELDALLQRMLALPVAPPEEEPCQQEEPADAALAVAEPPAPTPPPTALRLPSPAALLEPPPAPPVAAATPPQLPRPRRRTLWVRPLLWSNLAFDGCTGPLGAPGRWLRSAGGRAVLGVLGLLGLLAAAAVVTLEWTGWIW